MSTWYVSEHYGGNTFLYLILGNSQSLAPPTYPARLSHSLEVERGGCARYCFITLHPSPYLTPVTVSLLNDHPLHHLTCPWCVSYLGVTVMWRWRSSHTKRVTTERLLTLSLFGFLGLHFFFSLQQYAKFFLSFLYYYAGMAIRLGTPSTPPPCLIAPIRCSLPILPHTIGARTHHCQSHLSKLTNQWLMEHEGILCDVR